MAPRKLPPLKTNIAVLPPIESSYISRVPFIFGAIGSTGSGKSHLALSLIKLMRREKSLTKLYVVCPTVASNVIYKSVLTDNDWVFSGDLSKVFSALREVEADCEAVSEQYRKDLEYQIVLNKFRDGADMSSADETLLEMYGFRDSKPVRPSPCLIIDDCSHSPLFSSSGKNPLTNLVLRSRHCGDGLGLSIVLIAQTYTSGVPRALRQNLTHLALFRTQSEKEIKSMYEECGGLISFVHFKEMFNHYTANKHSYLWIDNIRRTLDDTTPKKKRTVTRVKRATRSTVLRNTVNVRLAPQLPGVSSSLGGGGASSSSAGAPASTTILIGNGGVLDNNANDRILAALTRLEAGGPRAVNTVPVVERLIAGPPGRDGRDGVSIRGERGERGADSIVPGPPGRDSTVPGPPGRDSTVPGPPGRDSTVPGPR
eukprot:15622-Heterococcus_DN1.PRE.3